MELVYPSVTLDELTPRAFEQLSIPDAHLRWATIHGTLNGTPLYVTYHRSGPHIETFAFDISAFRFLELEGWWGGSPLVLESEAAMYVGEGWRRTHRLDRFPTRSEILTELQYANTTTTRITAHYTTVPRHIRLPIGAYVQQQLDRSRTH